MKQGFPAQDTITRTPSAATGQTDPHPVLPTRTCLVSVTKGKDAISETWRIRVLIAEVPVRRAQRHSGGMSGLMHALFTDARQGYGNARTRGEGALIVTHPAHGGAVHKPNSLVTAAARLPAATTTLDPTFGNEPRGVMLMQCGGMLAALPLVVRRAIMQAALTRRDVDLLRMADYSQYAVAYEATDQEY